MSMRFVRSLASLATALALLATPFVLQSRQAEAFGNFSPTLTASDLAWSSSNTGTGEYTNPITCGAQIGDDGYCGTFSYDWSTTSGTGTVKASIVWQAYYYDIDDGWVVYDGGAQQAGTYGASSSGSVAIDFFALDGLPDAAYALDVTVYEGTTTNIGVVLGGFLVGIFYPYPYSGYGYGTGYGVGVGGPGQDPLPAPEPSPGPYPGDPPIGHPELPPTGPIGPGTSS